MSRMTTWGLAVGLAWMAAASANANQEAVLDRFTSIPQRNAFGLRAPEPIKPVDIKPPPPPVTVKLTGIIKMVATKKAILVVNETGKPPESKVMGENQKDGAVEVVEINADAGTVKLVVSGNETELNFDKDGIKPTLGAAPAGAAATAPPAPNAAALFSAAAKAAPEGKSFGTPAQAGGLASFLRQASTAASTSASTLAPIPVAGGMNAVGGPMSGVGFRFDGSPTLGAAQPKWPPEVEVSREESEIYIELVNELGKNSKVPLPPMPPTALNPERNVAPPVPPMPGQ